MPRSRTRYRCLTAYKKNPIQKNKINNPYGWERGRRVSPGAVVAPRASPERAWMALPAPPLLSAVKYKRFVIVSWSANAGPSRRDAATAKVPNAHHAVGGHSRPRHHGWRQRTECHNRALCEASASEGRPGPSACVGAFTLSPGEGGGAGDFLASFRRTRREKSPVHQATSPGFDFDFPPNQAG